MTIPTAPSTALVATGDMPGAKARAAARLCNANNTMSSAIKPKRDCPLCGYERDRERNLLRALINEIHTPEMRAAFEHSSGLCLPHANAALQLRGVSADGLRLMMQIERDILQRLKAELDEYLVKSNGSYDYEGMGTEADAPARAVKLVSGRVFGRR